MRKFWIIITLFFTTIESLYLYAEDCNSVYKKAIAKFETKDYKSAIALFREAYSLGDTILSPMRIGEFYICGYGVTQNESEGLRWVQIAAENNNSEAQSTMGKYFSYIGEDPKAFNWFFKAAQNGDDYGKYMLGKAYLEGKGTFQDSKKALRWTLSSAQGGNPGAQWEMAIAYSEGHNHPFDLDCNADEVIIWTQKAADNGLPVAQYYLGLFFLDGFNNRPVDKEKAKYWILKAADQEWPDAIKTLKERFK
ncbi:MAG: sel1 repeat family protein [Bacteroides sp.]|nr:sel1 repeat family protein [Bacteroides sp.]